MAIALFDFDGTITTRETMPAFVRGSVGRHRLLLGYIALSPLLIGYRLGIVSGSLMRAAIVRVAYTGIRRGVLERHGRAFARRHLDATLRPEAMARIAWHKAQGHQVAIVSGGLDVYLRHWAQRHDVALLCSSLEHGDGVLTGRYAGRQCVGEQKAEAVRIAFGLLPGRRIFAYGDTAEDRELLAMATDPFYRTMPAPGEAATTGPE
jgi:phosphatidylglycerophosphatase C